MFVNGFSSGLASDAEKSRKNARLFTLLTDVIRVSLRFSVAAQGAGLVPTVLSYVRIESNRVMIRVIAALAGALLTANAGVPKRSNLNGTYIATAYAQKGITASGLLVHQHVVAADPDLLPVGTRIKIKHAGRYSGEYVVADTGDKIQGRKLDIYLPSVLACKKFGVKSVRVKVISVGDGTHTAAKQADEAVKQDVKQELNKNAVGSAATEGDWARKAGPQAATPTATTNTVTATKKTTETKTDH
jgi:3D (Asp-Asp-Asp) domain-containing protein